MADEKQMAGAKVFNVLEMIHIQEGAVVSRTLVNQPTGTITLFAFDAGQSLSEHTAPYDALVQVLEGDVEITIKGEPFQLKAGETILMPANAPHGLKTAKGLKMMLVMIKS